MRKDTRTNSKRWATLLLLHIVLALNCDATVHAAWKEVRVSRTEFYMERLKFFYLTEDYVDSSILTEELLSENPAQYDNRKFLLLKHLISPGLEGQSSSLRIQDKGYMATISPGYNDPTREVFLLPFLAGIAMANGDMGSAESFMRTLFASIRASSGADLAASMRTLYPDLEEAIIKTALWHVEERRYQNALSFIDEGRPFLSPSGLIEGALVEVHSLMRLGRREEALEVLGRTMGLVDSLRETHREILEGRAEKDSKQIPSHSKAIARLNRLHATLESLDSLYRARLEEAVTLYTTTAERLLARKNTLEEIEQAMVRAAGRIQRLSGLLAVRYHATTDVLETHSNTITRRWQKLLNRRLTDTEKTILYMTLLDGKEALWYLDNTMYCQLLYFMAMEDNRISRQSPAIFETLMVDLESTANNRPTGFSKRLEPLKDLTVEATKRDAQLLNDINRIIDSIELSLRIIEKKKEDINRLYVRLSVGYVREELGRLDALKERLEELAELLNRGGQTEEPEAAYLLRLISPHLFGHSST